MESNIFFNVCGIHPVVVYYIKIEIHTAVNHNHTREMYKNVHILMLHKNYHGSDNL
jgi:hypothetical protein